MTFVHLKSIYRAVSTISSPIFHGGGGEKESCSHMFFDCTTLKKEIGVS